MIILNGEKIAKKILAKVKRKIDKNKLNLKLAVVSLGSDRIGRLYVEKKKEACEKVGIKFFLFQLKKNIKEKNLKKQIKEIVQKKDISGVVVQLPLPKKFNREEILSLIPSFKDPDLLSPASLAEFWGGTLKIEPPIVKAVEYFLKEYKISLKRKKVVLVGLGKLVGKPLAIWLFKQGADFAVVEKDTRDAFSVIKKADIIISGAGSPKIITGEMVKKGAVVIDAGLSTEKKRLLGDVDFDSVSKKASFITPVRRGIGPVVVACLLENLVELNK